MGQRIQLFTPSGLRYIKPEETAERECTKKIVIRGDVHNKVLWQSLWLHWIEAGREEDGLSEEVQFMTF